MKRAKALFFTGCQGNAEEIPRKKEGIQYNRWDKRSWPEIRPDENDGKLSEVEKTESV